MYKSLLVFEETKLVDELMSLTYWGKTSGFMVTDVALDALEGYIKAKNNEYDIMLIQDDLANFDNVSLIECVKKENLCKYVIMCGKEKNFDRALFGIRNNVFDYMIFPIGEEQFMDMVGRIKNEMISETNAQSSYINKAMELFKNQNKDFLFFSEKAVSWISEKSTFFPEIYKKSCNAYEELIEKIYDEYGWLDMYVSKDEMLDILDMPKDEISKYADYIRNKIDNLFNVFCELYKIVPQAQIEAAIIYILNNPETDLLQKDIAEKIYMNTSVFSTLFKTHVNEYFGVYIANVKLYRGAYLLRTSDIRISKLAELLGYKDAAYFSRLFKQKFKMTPIEYQQKNMVNILE